MESSTMKYVKFEEGNPNYQRYTILADGRVYSHKTRGFLTLTDNRNGYLRVQMGEKAYYVHRLVAEAFIPNPDNKQYVNHIDSNPYNNDMSNLEWCTQYENIRHGINQGRIKGVADLSLVHKVCEIVRDNPLVLYDEVVNMINDERINRKVVSDVMTGSTHKPVSTQYFDVDDLRATRNANKVYANGPKSKIDESLLRQMCETVVNNPTIRYQEFVDLVNHPLVNRNTVALLICGEAYTNISSEYFDPDEIREIRKAANLKGNGTDIPTEVLHQMCQMIKDDMTIAPTKLVKVINHPNVSINTYGMIITGKAHHLISSQYFTPEEIKLAKSKTKISNETLHEICQIIKDNPTISYNDLLDMFSHDKFVKRSTLYGLISGTRQKKISSQYFDAEELKKLRG